MLRKRKKKGKDSREVGKETYDRRGCSVESGDSDCTGDDLRSILTRPPPT